jgi:hypothetical protein
MKISILTNENNIVAAYGICLSDTHNPLPNGIIIETDIDTELLMGNYKLVDGALIELFEEEKPLILPEPTVKERIEAIEAALLEVVLGG